MTRLWIKKRREKGHTSFVLMQTVGVVKREIESSSNKKFLEARKKFLLHIGAFEGPLPMYMTKSVS